MRYMLMCIPFYKTNLMRSVRTIVNPYFRPSKDYKEINK